MHDREECMGEACEHYDECNTINEALCVVNELGELVVGASATASFDQLLSLVVIASMLDAMRNMLMDGRAPVGLIRDTLPKLREIQSQLCSPAN